MSSQDFGLSEDYTKMNLSEINESIVFVDHQVSVLSHLVSLHNLTSNDRLLSSSLTHYDFEPVLFKYLFTPSV